MNAFEAPRPKGRGFPVRYFFCIVSLDPALKGGAYGALAGQDQFHCRDAKDAKVDSFWLSAERAESQKAKPSLIPLRSLRLRGADLVLSFV
jgi:hypothetical protein